jgi:hypothetical protein
LVTGLLLASSPSAARAWIYPEHRDIAVAGVDQLEPARQLALQALWEEARVDFPARLCPNLSEGDQGLAPACIDFAAIPALSGDHSCSPQDVVENVLPSPWILGVARVAAETRSALAAAPNRSMKLNRIAQSNVKLQWADPDYATRAGANNAHFLLPREGDDAHDYLTMAIAAGTPINAIGLYVQYHVAALGLAQRHATAPPGDPAARAAMARQVIALEGYALHWIEDAYASGHVVGTWGDAAWRKGTHDYYNEAGVDTSDWPGKPLIMFGDSFIRPADLARASAAVAASLSQLANALQPGDGLGVAAQGFGPGASAIFAFSSCLEKVQPSDDGASGAELKRHLAPLVLATPVPRRGEGDVHMPRFREELGPFMGVFGSIDGGTAWGGLLAQGNRGTASVAAGARLGFGAESLTGTPGTALVYLDVGLSLATAQVNGCSGATCAGLGGSSLFPAVPARAGLQFGARVPFWLIPGDTLLLVPILWLVSPKDMVKVAMSAASGGLLGYEQSFLTPAGSFQVVVGREVQATLYGFMGSKGTPLLVVPVTLQDGSTGLGVLSYQSVNLTFPVVEWTPFRSFATRLAFAVKLQLGLGVELPSSVRPLYPAGASLPPTPPTWSVFLRGSFDGRYFIGSTETMNEVVLKQ